MNKFDLEKLAEIRILEAEALLSAKLYQGAYYLIGYALECLLKACIAKQVNSFDFPNKKLTNDSFTHDLRKLLITAGLSDALNYQESQDKDFKFNWALAIKWSEESRYDHSISEKDAQELYEAITNQNSGVLPWLKNFL
jgi:hypothetical protein